MLPIQQTLTIHLQWSKAVHHWCLNNCKHCTSCNQLFIIRTWLSWWVFFIVWDAYMLVYKSIFNESSKRSFLRKSGVVLDWQRNLWIVAGAVRGLIYHLALIPMIRSHATWSQGSQLTWSQGSCDPCDTYQSQTEKPDAYTYQDKRKGDGAEHRLKSIRLTSTLNSHKPCLLLDETKATSDQCQL